jgi:hypothetical protein
MKTQDFKANLCTLNEIFVINESYSILLTNKVSGYGSGKKTVYSGKIFKNIDGQKNEIVFENAAIDVIKKMLGCKCESAPRKSKQNFTAALDAEKNLIANAFELLEKYGLQFESKEIDDVVILANNEDLRKLKEAEEKAEAEAKAKEDTKDLLNLLKSGDVSPEILAQVSALIQASRSSKAE